MISIRHDIQDQKDIGDIKNLQKTDVSLQKYAFLIAFLDSS